MFLFRNTLNLRLIGSFVLTSPDQEWRGFRFCSAFKNLSLNHTCSQDEKEGEGEDREVSQGVQPVEDSLAILWDVVSALHDKGWHEDDMPRAILRLWKTSTIEPRLSNLSSLSLPEDFVTADTIPVELTAMGPCEIASTSGVDVGTTRYEHYRA